jgi:signal transduction histidine kinase
VYHGDVALTVLDVAVGLVLLGLGLAVRGRGAASGPGWLLPLTAGAWFAGSGFSWAVDLHRGPFAQLLLSYPGRAPRGRVEQAAVAFAYVAAVATPLVAGDELALALAATILAVAARRYVVARGPERRARATALGSSTVYGLVLAIGALSRLGGAHGDRPVLVAYELSVAVVAAVLAVDSLRARWAEPTVTELVVDLGDVATAGTLRDTFAGALGDPSLVLGFRVRGEDRFVDEAGRPVLLERAVTPIEEAGKVIAVLVHDPAALEDPRLAAAVAPAARLALSTRQLSGEVRARVAEVEASRRRIIEAADAQRRRLERELHDGAERHLARAAELLDGSPDHTEVATRLTTVRGELREFARGIHPAVLTERGLAPALRELTAGSPVPVELAVTDERLAASLEEAVYFVCAEALTNVVKYAGASRAVIDVSARDGVVAAEIRDDGVGGADISRGTGLRGLADRVEALGGELRVTSGVAGTSVRAELPFSA